MPGQPHSADLLFQTICKNYGIQLEYMVLTDPEYKLYDTGLRELFYQNSNYQDLLHIVLQSMKHNVLYRFRDEFMSKFLVFIHPELTPDTMVIIGPYRTDIADLRKIYEYASAHSVRPVSYPLFKSLYQNIPWLSNEMALLTMATSYGEIIWGGLDRFTVEQLDRSDLHILKTDIPGLENTASLQLTQLNESEIFYTIENQLLEAISRGNAHVAELQLEKLKKLARRDGSGTTLEETRHYAHALNALFRKATEKAGVPPYFIDEVSDSFSRQIALLSSVSKAADFQQSLILKYCGLVNNMSMAKYAPTIRRVISYIHMDLTNDLELRTLAELFHVERKYLSTLFHESTGVTLTEYVQRKRLEHAVFLMENTDLPISAVAQHCGILDSNYFSRLFRRYYSVSPSHYRNNLRLYPIQQQRRKVHKISD